MVLIKKSPISKTNGYYLFGSDLTEDVVHEAEVVLPWSLIDMREDGIEAERLSDRVLGLSSDKSVSFAIGFANSWNHVYVNIPYIRVTHENGEDEAIFMINPCSHTMNHEFKNETFSLSESAKIELQQLLQAAQQITFIPIEEE